MFRLRHIGMSIMYSLRFRWEKSFESWKHHRFLEFCVSASLIMIFLLVEGHGQVGENSEEGRKGALSRGAHWASRQGERIVILGGGFAERLQHFGYFETLVVRHASEKDVIVRNLGWSGDTVGLMPRPYNFIRSAGTEYPDDPSPTFDSAFDPDHDHRVLRAHLAAQEADTILLCFGAVEAFEGKAGLEKFSADYQRLIDHLLEKPFRGDQLPRLILVSPIAQEALGEPFSDPAARNADLKLYSETIAGIAARNELFFVDLFEPSLAEMSRSIEEDLTIDGLQLNAAGQQRVAEILAAGLGITDPWTGNLESLRELVVEKNRQFFYRWRPINGEYVYGRRREPFGVLSYPPEMEQLDKAIVELESRIHSEARKLAEQP